MEVNGLVTKTTTLGQESLFINSEDTVNTKTYLWQAMNATSQILSDKLLSFYQDLYL